MVRAGAGVVSSSSAITRLREYLEESQPISVRETDRQTDRQREREREREEIYK